MVAQVKTSSDAKVALGAAFGLVTFAVICDSGTVGWMIAPIFLMLCWYAMSRASLRDIMLVLMFLGLVLEDPAERPGAGYFSTPFLPFGQLMLTHLKTTIGGPWFFGGTDIFLVSAIVVAYRRRRQGTPIERSNRVGTPKQMIQLAYGSLATIVFVWFVGKFRGGDDQANAVWQISKVIYVPIVFLLFQAALVGRKDHIAVGKVILVAGTLRAMQALYVKWTVAAPIDRDTGESSLVYATTHSDSILFALTCVLLVSLIIHPVGKRAARLALLLLPVLVGGMLANNRRMVWVQVILVFATLFFMTEANRIKRKIQRVLFGILPFLAGYIAVGWSSTAKFFKPVQTIRSAMDPSTDMSTQWRELENYDLIFTLKQFPIFGTGYGHGFYEILQLPAVDYPLEHFIPHNSILGMWCFMGYVGFVGITALWVGGVYMGIRAYHHCAEPIDKAAALVSFASVLVYLVQCFGDIGLGCWAGVFTVAPCLAVATKLAVSTGGWPMPNGSGRTTARAGADARGRDR